LAFVSNKNPQNRQPPKVVTQQVATQPTQSPTTKTNPPGWTYLPPNTLVSAPSNNKSVQQSPVSNTAINKPAPSTSQQPLTSPTSKSSSHYVPVSSLLPPPSELATSSASSSSTTNGSLLPPPSQLLLSGLKAESEVKSKSSDSAYGSLTSNSSASRLTASLMNDPFIGANTIPRIGNLPRYE
jgi:hypothetical protein